MSASPIKFYRIRSLRTGLFSKGSADAYYGSGSHWTKTGKIWKGTGPLRNHLAIVIQYHKSIPDDWEVVEYEMHETNAKSAMKYIDLMKMLKRK